MNLKFIGKVDQSDEIDSEILSNHFNESAQLI